MKVASIIAKYFLIYVFIAYLLNVIWLVLVNSAISNENELLQSFTVFYINLTGVAFLKVIMGSASWLLPISLNGIPIPYQLQPVLAALGLIALGFVDKSIKWVYVLFTVVLIIFLAYYLPVISYVGAFQNALAASQFLVLNFAVYLLYRLRRDQGNTT